MDKMQLITLAFVAFPEGLLLSASGLAIMGVRPRLLQLVLTALLFVPTAYLVRKVTPLSGAHSLIILSFLALYLKLFFSLTLEKTVAAAFIPFLFLTIGESLFLPIFMKTFSVTIPDILGNPLLRIQAALPQQALLFLVFIIAYRLRRLHRTERRVSI